MAAIVGGGLTVVVVLIVVALLVIGRSHKQTAATQPQPTQPQTPSIPAVAPTGTLEVQGNLGDVDVFVDGVLKGFTQGDGKLSLPLDPGTHTVRFTRAGYEDFQPPPVTISANQQSTLSFDLKQSAGAPPPPPQEAYLTIHSSPGASVSVDGASQGKTDAQGSLIIPVKPGKRSVQIGLEGYQPFSHSVNVKAGEKPILAASLITVPVKPPP